MGRSYFYIPFIGVLFVSLRVIGQAQPEDDQFFWDSLRRQALSEGFLCQDYYFSYSPGGFTIATGSSTDLQELHKLKTFLHFVTSGSGLSIVRIRLTGYSSIEGDYQTNETLSRERVRAFHQYLREAYPALYRFPYDLAWVAEDWNELSRLVRDSDINEWEEILEIIRKVPSFDERERLLVYLNGGRAYRELERSVFPKLRRVEIRVNFTPVSDPAPSAPSGHLPLAGEELAGADRWLTDADRWLAAPSNPQGISPSSLSLGEGGGDSIRMESTATNGTSGRFTFKTNLLLWAGILPDFRQTTPVLNGALEYAFTRNFSLHIDALYSYWRYNDDAKFQGISGYSVEPRFSPSLPTRRLGIFLGSYVRFGDYDLQKTESDNATGNYWDAGFSAGLKLRLLGPLGLEVGARAGYVSSKVHSYTRDNLNNWYAGDRKYHKWKLTGLNASLTYSF